MESETLSHVINRVVNSPIQTHPYPHFYIENLFPNDFYKQLLSNLPDSAFYHSLSSTGKVSPGTYSSRLVLPLEADRLTHLPFMQSLYWNKFTSAISGKQWHSTLLAKFDPYIRERFGDHYDNVRFSSTAELVRDHTNYSIGPHTDHPVRVITLLFYFPKFQNQSHLGTSIYEPLDPAFECEGFEHHPFDAFKRVYTAPFAPNSLFGFVRSNRSFHGREPIVDEKVERNLMNYYLEWWHK